MKIKQSLFLVFMVLISLCLISAVSAADDLAEVVEVDSADEVQAIDNVDEDVVTSVDESDIEEEVVLEAADEETDEPVLSAEDTAADTLGKGNFSLGGRGGNGSSFDFSNITFNVNGTNMTLGDLLNGTTISFNGTTFNISDLLNGTMSFGNGTSFNISSIINMTGNGTGSFNISAILDMIGGKTTKITFDAKDISQVYSGPITFKVKVLENDSPVAQKTVIITIDNKDYVARTDENGIATVTANLAAGTHYVYTEYNNVIGKNKIEIKKAASKITAKKKKFKAKKKTKKYAITLKDNKGKAIKNAKVTLKIKKKTFTAKTNAKGKATFKIKKLTKKSKYNAKIKFAGNGFYKASSAKAKIILK